MTALPPPAEPSPEPSPEPPPEPDPAFARPSRRRGPAPGPVGPLLPGRRADPDEPLWRPSPLAEVLPGPQVIVVRNDDDGPAVRGYLKRFYDLRFRHCHPHRYVLVRPTPGATDRTTFALDVLAGLGKNPDTMAAERLGPAGWDYARAWLAGSGTTDVVVDRAHLLGADRLADLAGLAAWLECQVWLIWSGGGELAPVYDTARAVGARPGSIFPDQLNSVLPIPDHEPFLATQSDRRVLPTAEFTTFRAACRRLLSPREFAHVDQLYRDAADRTDVWLGEHGTLRAEGVQILGSALAAWLRDTQLGPHIHAGTALVILRGTQAALFIRGVLLRWNPATLGPDAATALCGDLYRPRSASALYSGAKTGPAAITTLSWHLNQPPLYFDCWRIRHAARTGAALTAPAPGDHHHQVPAYLRQADYRAAIEQTSGVEEIPCAHTVRLPESVHAVLAAHRAYRLLHGATEHDPLFEQGRSGMRETAIRTAGHLHQLPPWLHRDPCRYGGDIGLNRRAFGWLVERGLSVHLLDAELADQLHHPLHHRGEP